MNRITPNPKAKVFHVASLGHALELCALARIHKLPNPTFTVDAEDFARFEKYMAKSYTVHWHDGAGGTIPVTGILPLFQPVKPGEPRGEIDSTQRNSSV